MVKAADLITIPRESGGSLAEMCPWISMVQDDKILTIDGMVLSGFEFSGMDVDGKTDEAINRQISILESALNTLDENITLWSYLDRRKVHWEDSAEFSNWYASACHDQLNKMFGDVVPVFTHSLFIGYKLPNLTDSVTKKIALYSQDDANVFKATWEAIKDVFTGRGTVAVIKNQLAEMIVAFDSQLDTFQEMASNLVTLEKLRGEKLLGTLYKRMNPASKPGPLKESGHRWFLGSRMCSDVMVRNGTSIRFDGVTETKYVNVLSVIDEPEYVSSVHIDSMLHVDAEYTICQTFEILDKSTAKKIIEDAEQYYKNEVKSLGTRLAERVSGQEIDKINTGNSILAEEAQEALALLTTEGLTHGFHSTKIIIYADNEDLLRKSTNAVDAKMRINGYSLSKETTGLFGVYLSSLPGYNKINPRKYLASVDKIADLMPVRGKYSGETTNKCLSDGLKRTVPSHIMFATEAGVPYNFNFHVKDVGHALIIGGTGAGKTVFVNLAITEFQKYSPCRTYIFDKDYSMSVPVLLLGGTHIDGGKTGALATNPIKRFLKDNSVSVAAQWLKILLQSDGAKLSNENKEVISKALQMTMAGPSNSWHLATVYTYIRGHDQELASRLLPFIDISSGNSEDGVGIFSGYFDAEEDSFELSSILCFECSKIIKMEEICSAFLFYVTYCIEKSLDGTTPTFIYIEESWFYFKNPEFAEILEDWLRTLRKKLAFVVMVTQGAEEFKKIPCGETIVGLCPTKIFLPMITDMPEGERNNYKSLFGLNEEEFSMIENAIPKRDYIIKQPGITKLVISKMPDLTLASNGASAKETTRNQAIEMSLSQVNWEKKYIKEVLHVEA